MNVDIENFFSFDKKMKIFFSFGYLYDDYI